jgi:hypothetical protein
VAFEIRTATAYYVTVTHYSQVMAAAGFRLGGPLPWRPRLSGSAKFAAFCDRYIHTAD